MTVAISSESQMSGRCPVRPGEKESVFLGKNLAVFAFVGGVLATPGCGHEGRSGFCGGFEEVSIDFEGRDVSDGDVLREHIDALAELNAPEEVAPDWAFVVESWEEFSDVDDVDVDQTDLDAAEELVQRSEEYRDALRDVRSHLRDECGFDLD